MSPTDTILVIVNAKARYQAALAKAALLAQKYQARLELFGSGANARSGAMELLAQPLRDAGLEVETVTVCADRLSHALSVRVKDPSLRFVIKDVVHSASARRAELTHTDWQLARACPVPLLMSKPMLWSELPLICAAIDPLHEDDGMECLNGSILAQGGMLAKRMNGELHVLHAFVPPSFVMAAPAANEVRALELAQAPMSAPANARFRELRSLASEVPESQVHFLIGSVREALTGAVTQLGASIVVLGALSRAGLRADAIGSTAEGLLKHIRCDVLVVKGSRAALTPH